MWHLQRRTAIAGLGIAPDARYLESVTTVVERSQISPTAVVRLTSSRCLRTEIK